MGLLRCDGYDVVLQEVPGEISLAINVTECPHNCVGCHSGHLANSYGDYVRDVLPEAITRYDGMITCICFMGGDQHLSDLAGQCKMIRCKYPNIKLAIYTGADSMDVLGDCVDYFDYIKIGHYDDKRGGLDSPITNQRMYRKNENGDWDDITFHFWR